MDIYGNENGSKVYSVPVEWVVTAQQEIRANSWEEAVQFVKDNAALIPLAANPEYVDGSYRITPVNGNDSTNGIAQALREQGAKERSAHEFDFVQKIMNWR